MIRVNLLKNRVQSSPEESGMVISDDSAQARSAVVKVFLLGLSTVGLMLFESNHLNRLRLEQSSIFAQVQALQVTVDQKVAEAESLKSVESEAVELSDKLKLLKHLSKLRLREVKTLDFLQTSIPERLWLRSLSYDDSRFRFEGGAVGTPDISEFVKRLDESAYLSDVIVTRNREVGSASAGYRDFEFTAMVENQQ